MVISFWAKHAQNSGKQHGARLGGAPGAKTGIQIFAALRTGKGGGRSAGYFIDATNHGFSAGKQAGKTSVLADGCQKMGQTCRQRVRTSLQCGIAFALSITLAFVTLHPLFKFDPKTCAISHMQFQTPAQKPFRNPAETWRKPGGNPAET